MMAIPRSPKPPRGVGPFQQLAERRGREIEKLRAELEQLQAERDVLREQLAAANGRAETAEAITARVGARMAEYDRHGSGMVNVRQVINLLSPTWPDGNYSSGEPT